MNAVNLPAAINDVRDQLSKMDGEFRMALPPHISADKFKRVAMTAIQGNPDLLSANRRSLFQACVRSAQDGLLPDGREAALVIFKGSVQYMPMVAGILKRVRNSGELSSITSQIVYRNDSFRYWVDGDGEHIQHEPLLFGDRGEIVGVYAIAKTKDGAVYVEPMTKAQVEKVRKVSRAANNGPWVSWWEEMARKTAIRRLSKRLPTSTDVETILQREDDAMAAIACEPIPKRPQLSDFTESDPADDDEGQQQESINANVITVYDVFGAEVYSGLVKRDAERTLRDAAKGLSPDELQSLRELNETIYDAVFPPDHVGSEFALPPIDEPRLATPEGEVLLADKEGLARWQKEWRAQFDRIDLEPADVMAALAKSASDASGVFADKPETVKWIEAFVASCRARVEKAA